MLAAMWDAALQGGYFAAIAIALAMVEVQIEGPHGWAEKLPTWRWGPAWFLRYTSRPVTGYHVWMITLLVLFSHQPLLFSGFSWGAEARIIARFLVMTVVWDILWFLLNPAYGWARFARHDVWWYRHWFGPFPTDYWLTVGASLGFWLMAGAASAAVDGFAPLLDWGVFFGVQVAVVIATDIAFGVRPAAPETPAGGSG